MPRPNFDDKLRRIIDDEYGRRGFNNTWLGCLASLILLPIGFVLFIGLVPFLFCFLGLTCPMGSFTRPTPTVHPDSNKMNINTEEGREEIPRLADEHRWQHLNVSTPSMSPSP
jgi:hypothetical protein